MRGISIKNLEQKKDKAIFIAKIVGVFIVVGLASYSFGACMYYTWFY